MKRSDKVERLQLFLDAMQAESDALFPQLYDIITKQSPTTLSFAGTLGALAHCVALVIEAIEKENQTSYIWLFETCLKKSLEAVKDCPRGER